MMSLWDALRMNMMISYQELVRTFPIILLENGSVAPSLDVLNKYSEHFEIPVKSLLFFSESLYKSNKFSERFRLNCAGKILNVVEWIAKKNEI